MARLSEEKGQMAFYCRSQRFVEGGEKGVESAQWLVWRTGRGRGRRERHCEKETKKTRMGHASWPENKYALFCYSLHSVNVILSCKLWTLTTILIFFQHGERRSSIYNGWGWNTHSALFTSPFLILNVPLHSVTFYVGRSKVTSLSWTRWSISLKIWNSPILT